MVLCRLRTIRSSSATLHRNWNVLPVLKAANFDQIEAFATTQPQLPEGKWLTVAWI
jgi:hypothetical protein